MSKYCGYINCLQPLWGTFTHFSVSYHSSKVCKWCLLFIGVKQWDLATNFHLWDNSSEGLNDGSLQVESTSAPRYGAEAVCRHWWQMLTAETIKIWKFRIIHLRILDQYVSRWGTKWQFWGLSPSSMPGACHWACARVRHAIKGV